MSRIAREPDRNSGWPLKLTAVAVAAIGIVVVSVCIHGSVTGWLGPVWHELTDAQATLIASLCTVYAAVFASIVAPTLFGGQLRQLGRASEAAIAELKANFATVAAEQQSSSRQMLDAAEQSKASLMLLQNYALHMMGFVEQFTQADVANAKHILGGFQQSAAILCQNALANSNKWSTTKAQFDGMWPGYQPYIAKLWDLGIISDEKRSKLLEIADSRKYTRAVNPETIDVVKLNLLNKTMKDLQASFSAAG